MRVAWRVVLTVLILGVFSSAAFAIGVDISVSNQLQYQSGDEVSPYITEDYPHNLAERRFFENQMLVDLYVGDFRLGFRYLKYEPSDVDIRLWALEDESRIDKRFVEWFSGGLEFRVGDFSAIFGKGLTLYLFEDRLLFHDTELDGIKLIMNQGPFSFTALKGEADEWGTVRNTSLIGFNAEAYTGWLILGVNYVKMDSGGYSEADLPGGYLEIFAGPVTLYGEYAEKATKVAETIWGRAVYLSGSVAGSGYSLFADYKYYQYEGATLFQNPPVVQRELTSRLIQSRDPHVVSFDDEVGFQVEGQITPVEWATFTANFTHSSAIVGEEILPSNDQLDRVFIEWLLEADVTPSPEHRVRFGMVHDEEARRGYFEDKTGFYTEWEDYSMEPYSSVLLMESLWVKDRQRNHRYQDWLWEATVTHSPDWSFSVTYQFTTDDELASEEGSDWFSQEMSYSFGDGRHTLSVFHGAERGGLKCTGGVCRRVQAFEGWKISLDSTF